MLDCERRAGTVPSCWDAEPDIELGAHGVMNADGDTRDDNARPTKDATTATGISVRRKILIGALTALIVVAGALVFTFDTGDELSEFHQIEITTLDGDALSFASLAGKPVLLNFFASWCGPCIAEMPVIEALSLEFADELTVVGLAFEDVEPARDIVESTGITYLTGLDTDGILLERFDGFGMPTTVFVDGSGKVADIHIGELTKSAFRDKLREHLDVGGV